MFSGKNDPKTVINDLQVASNDLNLAKTEGSPPKRDEFIKIWPNYDKMKNKTKNGPKTKKSKK